MANTRTFTVRPFKARPDLKDAFLIQLSAGALSALNISSGQPCELRSCQGATGTAIAWLAQKGLDETIVQTSETLRTTFGLSLRDKVTITEASCTIEDAYEVQLSDLKQEVNGERSFRNATEDDVHWAWYLEWILSKWKKYRRRRPISSPQSGKAEYVAPGMVFENVELKGVKRSFVLDRVTCASGFEGAVVQLYYSSSTSKVKLNFPSLERRLELTNDGVGGLDRQLQRLNKRLSAFNQGLHDIKMPAWYRLGGGILLHGPSGTGKTMLLKKLKAAPFNKVYTIDNSIIGRYVGDAEVAVRKIFDQALSHQPSLIVMDSLDSIAATPRSEGMPASLAPVIVSQMDRLEDAKVLVVAATHRLNDIDKSLRTPERLETEIEIPIPDAIARKEILKVLQGLPQSVADELSDRFGDRTHGYVGADLYRLLRVAAEKAQDQFLAHSTKSPQPNGEGIASRVDNIDLDEGPTLKLTHEDLENALLEVRPTAMSEVFLEAPRVRWSDIGGQHEVKHSLRRVTEHPFNAPTRMARLGLSQKKGLLLYGPPGCSKTLTAQALATEGGLNFIAVKGAELLSMYVGESERAVREVFRKARAASPSIIFFDEIDAIGASSGHNSGVNVLTTLLNEMDGIESLKGVLVLAATNKPHLLDPALLRPGRLDTILYVGPPNLDARREILKIHTRKMDVGDDVDIDTLASKTDGYSGAEMASICENAAWAAFDESDQGEAEVAVCERHFELALTQVQRQITSEVRERYENWSVGGAKKL